MSEELTHKYQVCGLRLESNIPFPLLHACPRAHQTPDIKFTLKAPGIRTQEIFPLRAALGNIKNGAGHPSIAVYEINQGFLLDCHNTDKRVEFVVALNGSWIDCYPQAETPQEDIELWLFGLVLAFLLQGRGIFSLHAAAVDCHGRAIAFLGHNGFGKSTLALFFLQQGHSLITDDVLPIVGKEGAPLALPVCSAINLWPETLAEFEKLDGHLSLSEKATSKHRYSLETLKAPFCKSAVPLRGIYFLEPYSREEIDRVQITALSQTRSLLDLIGYTRANSMLPLLSQKNLLNTYADLFSRVRVRHLKYPRGFEYLPRIYDAVLLDMVNH